MLALRVRNETGSSSVRFAGWRAGQGPVGAPAAASASVVGVPEAKLSIMVLRQRESGRKLRPEPTAAARSARDDDVSVSVRGRRAQCVLTGSPARPPVPVRSCAPEGSGSALAEPPLPTAALADRSADAPAIASTPRR